MFFPNSKSPGADVARGALKHDLAGELISNESYSANIKLASKCALRSHIVELAHLAVAKQGTAAFDMPKSAAALHEAGHAVQFTAEGVHVRTVRIKLRWLNDQPCWTGRTFTGKPWTVDPTTLPEADLQRARFELAGVCAEMVHEGDDFRAGSSLDEIARAAGIAAIAGRKLNCDPEELLLDQLLQVRATLEAHGPVVLAVAAGLERDGLLRGAALAALLAPIVEGSA